MDAPRSVASPLPAPAAHKFASELPSKAIERTCALVRSLLRVPLAFLYLPGDDRTSGVATQKHPIRLLLPYAGQVIATGASALLISMPRYSVAMHLGRRYLHPRDQIEGSGMGLAIVKKAVESLGGTIALASSEGHGATFYVTLPQFDLETVL